MLAQEALQPEDRDVAEERKRVLECQPVVESMVGSPLILQELSKVCFHIVLFDSNLPCVNVFTTRFQFPLVYFLPFQDLLMEVSYRFHHCDSPSVNIFCRQKFTKVQ